MLRPFITAILLLLPAVTTMADGDTGLSPIELYKAEGDYESVKESLEMAITGQGLLISGTLHVQEMLDRTAADLGYKNNIYVEAESLEFCSASMSHRMIRADPRNLAICPFTISLYRLSEEPEQVYVAFRRPVLAGDSDDAEHRVFKLMDDIVREAIE